MSASDTAGNQTYASLPVRYDGTPPSGGMISPAAGTHVRSAFTTTLTGVTDETGVAKAELWANGKYIGADLTAPYSMVVKTGTYTGSVQLTWKVTDVWGQARQLPARSIYADSQPPAVSITKAPANRAKVHGTVKLYVKASDTSGISRVELLVNGKVVARDTKAGYVLSLTTRKQPRHMTIRVRAYDRLGNVAYTKTRTWYR